MIEMHCLKNIIVPFLDVIGGKLIFLLKLINIKKNCSRILVFLVIKI